MGRERTCLVKRRRLFYLYTLIMKKRIFIILSILMSFSLTSCESIFVLLNKKNDEERQKQLEEASEEGNRLSLPITETLMKRDKEGIKYLFAPFVRSLVPSLDQQIVDLYDFVSDEFHDMEHYMSSIHGLYMSPGKSVKEVNSIYYFLSGEQKCALIIHFLIQDDYVPDNIDIWYIYVNKYETNKKSAANEDDTLPRRGILLRELE